MSAEVRLLWKPARHTRETREELACSRRDREREVADLKDGLRSQADKVTDERVMPTDDDQDSSQDHRSKTSNSQNRRRYKQAAESDSRSRTSSMAK